MPIFLAISVTVIPGLARINASACLARLPPLRRPARRRPAVGAAVSVATLGRPGGRPRFLRVSLTGVAAGVTAAAAARVALLARLAEPEPRGRPRLRRRVTVATAICANEAAERDN